MAPVIRVVERLIAPLRRRVLLMIGRAVVRLIDDSTPTQRMQVEALSGEILDDVERVQQYGFSSCPPRGARAVLLSVGGMRQHPVVIAAEAPEYRAAARTGGEVSLYTHLNRSRLDGSRADLHYLRLHGSADRKCETVLRSRVGGADTTIRMRGGDDGFIHLARGRSSITISDNGITMRAPRIDRERVT